MTAREQVDNTRTHLISAPVEALRSCAFHLELVSGAAAQEERRWTLSGRETRLGAHPTCDVRLADPSVSRLHARIEADALGHRLVDEGSKNGLWVNGLRARDLYLADGAELTLGAVRLRYTLAAERPVEHLLSTQGRFGALLGESAHMREVFAQLERVAQSDMTLLIEGESGTGKELAAEAVHARSARAARGEFVVFDCSAVSPTLIESELFGHQRGAFTGAAKDREGAFRRAEGGTLFLDEVGELPLELQPRLLRALERREVKAVGEDSYRAADVRVVAATNRDLLAEVEAGSFRADLYYRLAVIKVRLPPLRWRPDDVPLLVRHFITELSPAAPREVGYEAMRKLQAQPWRGNVRELRNVVARAVTLSAGHEARLETRFLMPGGEPVAADPSPSGAAPPLTAQELALASPPTPAAAHELSSWVDTRVAFKDAKARLVEAFEVLYWERLLEEHEQNVSAASRAAGIHRKSAEYLLKKLGVR